MNLTGGTVFKDPKAPDAERYKWVGGGGISREDYERIKKERPESWSPQADRVDVKEIFTVSGATSPDGIHWTRLKEPLSVEHSDTHLVAYYDQRLDKYVIYTRNYSIWDRSPKGPDQFRMWWDVGRRSIGRTASDTFNRFPVSEVILEPSPDMAPSDLLYTNCRTAIPGAPDLHLMFPALWHAAADDTTSILLASSIDGKVWNYLPGGPVFETGEFEEWDGGCIFAVPNLIELPNGDWALPYAGYIFPHKYPRGQWKIGTGYAIWPKGRMIALESADLGEFITVGFYPPGRKLKINAVTKRAGSIFVEVTDLDRKTIPGRSFADCNPIVGDKPWVDVTWKTGSDLGHSEGAPIALRFKLDRAAIYGLEFE
jgi:hypothetical protein